MGRAAVPASQSGGTDLQEQVDGALARGSSKLCSWVSPTIKVLGCWGRSAGAESPGWGFPTTERAPKPHGREFRERDSKGENQGNRWLVVQRVPRPKSKIPILETRPPSWGDSTRHKQSLRGPEPPLPEREARPLFLQRDTPHFNCPLIAAGPESPACGKFSAAPPTPRLHSCVRMSWGGVCSPREASPPYRPWGSLSETRGRAPEVTAGRAS